MEYTKTAVGAACAIPQGQLQGALANLRTLCTILTPMLWSPPPLRPPAGLSPSAELTGGGGGRRPSATQQLLRRPAKAERAPA
eukprot:SAG11_NODE_1599_length_4608_cov_8.741184_5_plen_83_part_00